MVYWFLWVIFRIYFFLAFRVRIDGLHNLPKRGNVLLVANHISWYDPPFIGAMLPRRLFYLAKEELLKVPVLGPVLRWIGVFPVQRGSADRRAIRWVTERLGEGKFVLLFPEGTRSKTGALQAGQPGAALIAAHAGSLVVPIGIVGRYRFGQRLDLRIGEPLDFSPYQQQKLTRELLHELTEDRIMAAIAKLLDNGR